jgi:phosphatidylserine decarboxylase
MSQVLDGKKSIESIHEQMEVSPHYPYALQSAWLPEYGSASMQEFFSIILKAKKRKYADSIQALARLIDENEVVGWLVENACKENLNIIDSHLKSAKGIPIPRIKDKATLLHAFNTLLTTPPSYINFDLVGLPFSAFVVGIDPTLSGTVLFRLPMFNDRMAAILQEWNKFLDTPASNVGFRVEGEQWLSPTAKKQYDFPIWKKDSDTLPYWKSWNSFFTRQFENPAKERPIADPDSNRTVICPNDGSLFRWQPNIAENDVFWFKDMKYSLSDILSSPVKEQQKLIDRHGLVEMFTGGYIFQTYLNPYNFHRWWCPVNGEVLFKPFAIPGCFFNKLVLPDFGGATTASLPYLTQVNARGLIVFKTKDYGHVCCIPLGMSEVSSIEFDRAMTKGATVRKGQEMGKFNYGGSSFAIIYEKLPGKELVFETAKGKKFPQRPVLPKSSSGTGQNVTNIGAQIGVWKSV